MFDWFSTSHPPSFWFKVICIGILVLDIVFQSFFHPDFQQNHIAFYKDLPFQSAVLAEVVQEPDVRSNAQYLVVEAKEIYLQSTVRTLHGKIMVKSPRYPEYVYGEELFIRCKFQSPPVLKGFSYADFLEKDDIFVFCGQPDISMMPSGAAGFSFWKLFLSSVYQLKKSLTSRINELFVEPDAGLVAGILIGQRRSISQEILDDFHRTGLMHILVVDGYKFVVMMSVLAYFSMNFSRRFRTFFMMTGVLCLVFLSGFSASVLRAAFMTSASLVAQALGRKGSGLQFLLLSAVIMVFMNSHIYMDPSFQFSFLSTLGLILFMPKIENFQQKLIKIYGWIFLERIPKFIREIFFITLVAQVFLTPLFLLQSESLSFISPVANVFVLPFLPWIMFFTITAIMLSYLSFPLGQICSFLVHIFIALILFLAQLFANVPFASIHF